MKLYLSHSSKFDYQTELYEPLGRTLAKKHDVFFPHYGENINVRTKNIIATCDCVIAEVSYPSTGQGIELGWAHASDIPVVYFYSKAITVSSSLKFISNDSFEYTSPKELVDKLEAWFDK